MPHKLISLNNFYKKAIKVLSSFAINLPIFQTRPLTAGRQSSCLLPAQLHLLRLRTYLGGIGAGDGRGGRGVSSDSELRAARS